MFQLKTDRAKLLKSVFIGFFILLISCSKQDDPQSPPTVLTLEASEVKLTSFTMSGEVSNEGFNAAKERGFVWSSTNPNPSVSDNKVVVGYGKGQYSYLFEKLTANTNYYIKAFATNDKGTSYGETKTIKTADYDLATLSTEIPKNITYTSAELGGNVLKDGGIEVTEKGLCLAINKTPTIEDIKIANGKGIGSFANVVIKLQEGSNYIVRAYAINGKGISYGNEQKFTTISYKAPTLTTRSAQNIFATYATLSGNISDNGGAELIEKGFCLSKNPNPNISDIKVKSSNSEVGDFAIVITELEPSSKYYVRAYAQNFKGISYGDEISFTTTQGTIPSVGTNDFQEITQTSVRAGVEISSNGGLDITEFGVCLSTNRNPSINDRKVILGTSNSPGKMDNIFGLSSNTTYYLRGYAINRIGIAYGPEKSFTTNNQIQNSINSGLVAFFPFNGNTNEVIGNGSNGTNVGAALTTDRFNSINKAYYFSASNCSPRIEYILNTSSITTSLTISIWVLKVGNGCYAPRILDFASNPIDGPGQLQMGYGYENSWGIGHQKSNRTDLNSPIFPIGQIKWTHLVYTNDGVSAKYYQDGTLLQTVSNGTGSPILAKFLTIGRMNHPAYDAFNGKLDDIGIWNRALTSEEVNFLFQNNYQP
ncbi:MAG: LamG domain-containing protein [Cytophagaceae bacterium]|nr:LamG domain-containing protein [Cytophagaceae bacterium]MBP6093368.1 LamG domain-containing protein [Cytophagaceae bacterium]